MNKVTGNIVQSNKAYSVILGMGISGLSVARFYARHGKSMVLMDSRQQPPLLSQFKAEFPGVEIQLGGFDQRIINNASEIVLSPGLAKALPAVQQALNLGIPVVGDVEIFARQVKKPILAITGSNGKSTVTSLVSRMAQSSGLHAIEGGNIGVPVLDLISQEEQADTDCYVLELSSFQLETTENLATHASVILNLSPDHMDRYDSFADYCQAKATIYSDTKVAVINLDDDEVKKFQDQCKSTISFSLIDSQADFYLRNDSDGRQFLMHHNNAIIDVEEMKLSGLHNYANALAACALASTLGVAVDAMAKVLKTYTGLAHRTQTVLERQGVVWVNDSKGTNVGASCAAIQSIGSLPKVNKIVLIAGGIGKGADYEPMQSVVKQYARAAILMGEDANLLEQTLRVTSVPLYRVADMQEAVGIAAKIAQSGDAVLLSPAGASFDFYRNYVERGEHFESLVRNLD